MRWANFLHIYQPRDQQIDVLEAVVAQSYRPLLTGLRDHPKARITLNISGSLMELFDKYGYVDLIDMLRNLGKEGRVEFTSTAKYHAFLPLISEDEIHRQIKINNETNSFYLGEGYKPRGFFPPEMGYRESMAKVLEDLGFQWVLLDEIACTGEVGQVDYSKVYRIEHSNLHVFFRQRRTSNMIMSAVVRSPESFRQALGDDLKSDRYVLTGMDGETLGHHRPGLEKTFFEFLEMPDMELVTISELMDLYPQEQFEKPHASTWASSAQDIKRGVQFLSWHDPENQIHTWQWEFVTLALRQLAELGQQDPAWQTMRQKMDAALASDHFWWASAKPWWSLEMIESGAFHLLDVIKAVPNLSHGVLTEAQAYYQKIISTAFQWQRSGKIHQMMHEQEGIKRIPFKERTLGKGGEEEGVYHAFIEMMRGQEQVAVKAKEYEKAILWRDAIYKLEQEWDIYDAVNAIDLLRTQLPNGEVEKTIESYKGKYRQIRGGQPEQRGG